MCAIPKAIKNANMHIIALAIALRIAVTFCIQWRRADAPNTAPTKMQKITEI